MIITITKYEYTAKTAPSTLFWITYTCSYHLTKSDGSTYKIHTPDWAIHMDRRVLAKKLCQHKEIFLPETPVEKIEELIRFHCI